MRDSRPFERDFLVNDHAVAVILLIQLVVNVAQRVCGERCAALGNAVDLQLILRKHCLSVKRRAELFKEVIEQIRAFFFVGRTLKQIPHQQIFVAGRRDLGDENDIIGIQLALIMH